MARTVTGMDDLTAFITARLDEDEWMASVALGSLPPYPLEPLRDRAGERLPEQYAAHIAIHDPARVLREVAAKRAILAEHTSFAPGIGPSRGEPCCMRCGAGFDDVYLTCPWPCDTLKVLAAVWSEHPDYRQEWAPRP